MWPSQVLRRVREQLDALRQPVLAQALGLIYPVTLNVSPALVATGGLIWIALDTSNPANPWVADFKAHPDTVKSYAARLPELDAASRRPVFAARLFPVVAPPTDPRLAQPELEAEQYDDGFAQIVHSNQTRHHRHRGESVANQFGGYTATALAICASRNGVFRRREQAAVCRR